MFARPQPRLQRRLGLPQPEQPQPSRVWPNDNLQAYPDGGKLFLFLFFVFSFFLVGVWEVGSGVQVFGGSEGLSVLVFGGFRVLLFF